MELTPDVEAYPSRWPARLGVKVLHAQPGLLGTEIEVRPLIARFYASDAVQEEFLDRFTPNGTSRNREDIMQARGQRPRPADLGTL